MNKTKWMVLVFAFFAAVSAKAQTTLIDDILSEPFSVAVDTNNNYYVTDSANNRIVKYFTDEGRSEIVAGRFNGTSGSADNALGLLATFFNPQGIAYDKAKNDLLVTDSGNHTIRRVSLSEGTFSQVSTFVGSAGNPGNTNGDAATARFNFPVGIAVDSNSNAYITDLQNGTIRHIDTDGNVTDVIAQYDLPDGGTQTFLRPMDLAIKEDENGNAAEIFVADTGNHSIVKITLGTPNTAALISGSGSRFKPGDNNAFLASETLFDTPSSIAYDASDDEIWISDTGNNVVRILDHQPLLGQLGAFVLVDTDTQVRIPFDRPMGLEIDNNGNVPIVELGSNSLKWIQLVTPLPPITKPEIGPVEFQKDTFGELLTLVTNTPSATFSSDAVFAIDPTSDNVQTFYSFNEDATFDQNRDEWFEAPAYEDGLGDFGESIITSNIIARFGPTVTVRAFSRADGRISSPVERADYTFAVAEIRFLDAPSGNLIAQVDGSRNLNPLNVVMSNETPGAEIYYVIGEGPDPNAVPDPLQVDDGVATPTANAKKYSQNSILNIVEDVFDAAENGNSLVFKAQAFRPGFQTTLVQTEILSLENLVASGIGVAENLSAGVGSTIVLPLTVELEPGESLSSLQFRLELTPQNGAPAISDQLRSLPITNNDFIKIPVPATAEPITRIYLDAATNTRGIEFAYVGETTGLNLTGTQIAALFAVPIPATADPAANHSYSVAVVQPSGTSDGKTLPTVLTPMPAATLTVENHSYIVGDTASATWYNAGGDFGNSNLNNNDVNNAFHATMGIRTPYNFSDVFDAMDAYPFDSVSGAPATGPAGGDGQVRFLDWQTILRRSLRRDVAPDADNPELTYTRSWSAGGIRRAATDSLIGIPNLPAQELTIARPDPIWSRQAIIKATPVEKAAAGETVDVPVFIDIDHDLRLAGLQLRAKIVPSKGAPALSSSVQFAPKEVGLTQPILLEGGAVSGLPISDTVAAWSLSNNSLISGITHELGSVQFRVPENAKAGDHYTVQFTNVDGSPDASTQFDLESLSAIVWVETEAQTEQAQTSDDWRMNFFGTKDGVWTLEEADPDADGISNIDEFKQGTNPAELKFHLLNAQWKNANDNGFRLRWYTKPDSAYSIHRTDNFSDWTPVVTEFPGNGDMAEVVDNFEGDSLRFYRISSRVK